MEFFPFYSTSTFGDSAGENCDDMMGEFLRRLKFFFDFFRLHKTMKEIVEAHQFKDFSKKKLSSSKRS